MIKEFLTRQGEKARLMRVFRSGGIYLVKGEGKNKSYIYPTVHAVLPDQDKTEYVFSIPLGLDPVKVEQSFVIEQEFGSNYELDRSGKRFKMKVYHKELSKFKYRYSEIEPLLKSYRLPIVVGKSYDGYEIYDMVDFPHLLKSGETGSGKSTGLRSIITSLIKYKKPEELQLYLADLKRTEFHIFRRVKHVQDVAIIPSDLYKILIKLKKEMERRGDLLDAWELEHIDEYNKVAKEKLPYIILCIDEVAIIRKEKNIMSIVEDIGAIGRALGVFLILSMQRPDKDVLDGKLKNCLTVRIAYRHSDDINSWITLGKPNSHAADIKLTDRGRLWLKHESFKLIQSPELTIADAKKILEPYRAPRIKRKNMGTAEEAEPQHKILGVLDDA